MSQIWLVSLDNICILWLHWLRIWEGQSWSWCESMRSPDRMASLALLRSGKSDLLIPPKMEKTSGVKELISTSVICSSYCLAFPAFAIGILPPGRSCNSFGQLACRSLHQKMPFDYRCPRCLGHRCLILHCLQWLHLCRRTSHHAGVAKTVQ